ncbi:hypothetical protein Gasu2_64530 [Galdieria sulphuraria]|nr:hypothetical protein Gasu2_64530 [Galdieria sulphuraria]
MCILQIFLYRCTCLSYSSLACCVSRKDIPFLLQRTRFLSRSDRKLKLLLKERSEILERIQSYDLSRPRQLSFYSFSSKKQYAYFQTTFVFA